MSGLLRVFGRSRLFWAGMAIRLLCLPFFGSYYARDLFIPFLDQGVRNLAANPWTQGPANAFPYGSVLYVILALPRLLGTWLAGGAALGAGPLGMALLKLPLLGFDVLMLVVLCAFARERSRQLLLFYWLNPALIFITYVHGQLDLVAMTFCVLAIYLEMQRKIGPAALAMAAALLCKFHVAAILPFAAVYIWNREYAREAIRKLAVWGGVIGVLAGLGFLPLAAAGRFSYSTATSPEAFRLFAFHFDYGQGQVLYLGLLITLLVIGRLCVSTRITPTGLFFGSGAIFGALLLVTNSMPGWYFWVLPFLALFYSLFVNVPRSLYWGLSVVFVVYFGLMVSYPTHEASLLSGAVFTLLQTLLLGNLVALWMVAVRGEAVLQGRGRALVFGLSGDSGSGKNFFSQVLQDIFQAENTLVVEGDDYHKWERGHERWQTYTHLRPRANYLTTMAQHAQRLVRGASVFQPHYDHATGMFTPPRELKPSRTVIVQGLHTLYPRGLRRELDIKVFIEPQLLVRMAWKIRRDVKERGHAIEKVIQSIESRDRDAQIHIAPQKQFADWIIEYVPGEPVTLEEVVAGKEPRVAVRHYLWNDAPIENLVDAMHRTGRLKVRVSEILDDINRIVFEFEGDPTSVEIEEIAREAFPTLRHLTRGRKPPKWRGGAEGVSQLLALALIQQHTGGV